MKNSGLSINVFGLTKEIAEKVGFSKLNYDALTNGKENSAFYARIEKKKYFLAVNWDSFRYGFKVDEVLKEIKDGKFKGSFKAFYKDGKIVEVTKDTVLKFRYDGIDSAVIIDGNNTFLYTNRLSKTTAYGYENDEFKLVEKIG